MDEETATLTFRSRWLHLLEEGRASLDVATLAGRIGALVGEWLVEDFDEANRRDLAGGAPISGGGDQGTGFVGPCAAPAQSQVVDAQAEQTLGG